MSTVLEFVIERSRGAIRGRCRGEDAPTGASESAGRRRRRDRIEHKLRDYDVLTLVLRR